MSLNIGSSRLDYMSQERVLQEGAVWIIKMEWFTVLEIMFKMARFWRTISGTFLHLFNKWFCFYIDDRFPS